MKFAAWFAIIVGIGMYGQWGFSILGGQVPEFQTELYRIAFHLAAEFITAAMLIVFRRGAFAQGCLGAKDVPVGHWDGAV